MAKQMRVYDGSQWVEVASSTTDLTAYATKTGIETLTNKTLTSPTITGSGFDAWSTWTPTLTNFTAGTGSTSYHQYTQIGKTVICRFNLTAGTSPSISGLISVSLPVTASTGAAAIGNTSTLIAYAATPGTYYTGFAMSTGVTTSVNLYCTLYNPTLASTPQYTALANISTSAPVASWWVAGSKLSFVYIYEAA